VKVHELPATPDTVHWGYFDPDLEPVLTVADGDLVRVETVTHQAGDAPDLLMDDGITALYDGVTDRGPGPHILVGPIAVEGARPGDTLEVRVLAAEPRLGWGTNLAAHWGHLYKRFAKERVTVYRLDMVAGVARAAFAYDWTATPLADAPGTIVPPDTVDRQPALDGVAVPLRPHFGTMGVAPPESGRHSSIPPGQWGGNVDNWRIGPTATIYYPIAVDDALLSVGDPHVSQGDGEVSGTALEASLNGLLRIAVRRDMHVRTPLIVTDTCWVVHGFGDDLDEAMTNASEVLLELLVDRFGLSCDDGYSLMSVACDFGVTQVVDGRLGVHGILDRRLFVGGTP
jgi:acetamidase/formamidase